MKHLFSIILILSSLQAPFALGMDQAERAGMKLIQPGLWINASNQTVYVSARATEIQANEPCEFILIGSESGHGYESLLTTDALPSEIQSAVELIGLPAGSPSDGSLYRFWPRGERVTLKVHYAPPGGGTLQSHPVENFITQAQNKEVLPEKPWTFTGCQIQEEECLADRGLQSIIATYNEPYSIFTPPSRAGKGEAYGKFLRNAKNLLPEDHPVMLSISPEARPSGFPRTLDMILRFHQEGSKLTYTIGHRLHKAYTHQGNKPGGWVKWFKENITDDQDWHVTVDFDPMLKLSTVALLSQTLNKIEGDAGLRIGPPPTNQLYYKSFTPNPAHRERANRPHQPIELHIRRYANKYTSTLMKLTEEWSASSKSFEISEQAFKAPSAKALTYLLGQHHFPSDIAFIYCDDNVTLGDLQTVAEPLIQSVEIVYLFLSPAEHADE